MSTVEITNVGPIEHLAIPVPAGGGVVVMRGANGSGKTHAVEAAQRLLGNGKIKPEARDGQRKGTVEGFGARVNVSSRVTTTGELEVESLEGRFDLSTLVDPKIADPASADNKRIKALLSLLDWSAGAPAFHDLVGGEENFRSLSVEDTDDVVLLAARVKRALESRARDKENAAQKFNGEAAALATEAGEDDPSVDRDSAALNDALESAVRVLAKMEEQAEAAATQAARRKQAQAKLAELPTSELDILESQLANVSADIGQIEAQVSRLNAKRDELASDKSRLSDAITAERGRVADRATFEAVLADQVAEAPEDGSLVIARGLVDASRKAVEAGCLARANDQTREQAAIAKQRAKTTAAAAQQLRDMAAATDDVLSDAVGQLDVGLQVIGGRLCVDTDRGHEPVAELSDGERWRLVFDVVANQLGRGGVVALSQIGWEGLDPDARKHVHELAVERGLVVLAAEATGGELRAEEM